MAPDLNSLPPSRSSTSSPLHTRNLPSSSIMEGAHGNNNGASQTASSQSPSAVPISTSDLSRRLSLNGHRGSPRSSQPSISEGRRRSGPGIGMHLNLNDPPGTDQREHRSSSISNYFRNASPSSLGGSPIIGTGDPHHQRAPSLGELHQELEQEQEAQVVCWNHFDSMIVLHYQTDFHPEQIAPYDPAAAVTAPAAPATAATGPTIKLWRCRHRRHNT